MKTIFVLMNLVLCLSSSAQKQTFCHSSPKQITSFRNVGTAGLSDDYFYWDIGTTLYIRFMNGSPEIHRNIQSIAKQWERYANIKFEFRQQGESHIRIHLTNDYTDASLGIVANNYPQDMPNVHIDTTVFSDKNKRNALVLHVFGHVLGLEHENAVPLSGRKWNRNKISSGIPEKAWDETKIRFDILEPYSVTRSNGLVVDRRSIMYQSFPVEWTGEKSLPLNYSLSAQDTQSICLLYPFKPKRNVTEQFFSVNEYKQTRVETHDLGISFYPQFNIQAKDWPVFRFSILLYNDQSEIIYNTYGRYHLEEQLATTKELRLLPRKTYKVNGASNDFGLFLPYSEIPAQFRGQRLLAVFKVGIPETEKENASPDFNSKPFYISVPK